MRCVFLLLCIPLFLAAVEEPPMLKLKEVKRWSFFKEPTVYASGGILLVQDRDEKVDVLRIIDPGGMVRNLPLPRGEGPGETGILKGVVVKGNCMYLWDAQLRRLSRWDLKDLKYLDSRKFPSVSGLSKILAVKGEQPVFALCRAYHDAERRGMRQQIEGLAADPLVVIPSLHFSYEIMWSLKIPLMLSAAGANRIALADSTAYIINLLPLDGSPPRGIEREVKPVPWSGKLGTLFAGMDKQQRQEMAKYPAPERVHLLHALGLSEQRLAVCRNDFIEREEALIDFYDTSGNLLGQAVVPALYSQFVAILPAQFSLGFELLDDRHLACLHYDHDQELFEVVLYSLQEKG